MKRSALFRLAFLVICLAPIGCDGTLTLPTPRDEADLRTGINESGDGGARDAVDLTFIEDASNDGASDAAMPAGSPIIEYFGRFDTSDPAGAKFAWSGSAVKARFSGSSVAVTLRGLGWSDVDFTVEVDGVPAAQVIVLPKGSTQKFTLATWSSTGVHEVMVYRNNEANFGGTQFLGFDFGTGGTLLPPSPPKSSVRLEFYGDSITAGYADVGANGTCPGLTVSTQTEYETYAAKTARNLGAQPPTVIAWSGYGIYHDNSQNPPTGVNPTYPTLPMIYDQTRDPPSATWTFPADESRQPNVVVVNLGTNDETNVPSTGKPPSDATLQPYYVAFATTLRSHYPHALIVFAVGPTTNSYAAVVESAVKQLNATDPDVHSLVFALEGATGVGCDGYHPSDATHTKMAAALTAYLQSLGIK